MRGDADAGFLGRALAVLVPDGGKAARAEAIAVLALATAAALAIKAPELFGVSLVDDSEFYARNVSLFVLPLLAGYFVWKRGFDLARTFWLALAFAAAAVFANVFPFERTGATELLTALHLPIALWVVVGAAYAGERWRSSGARMEFVRFSGELFIYYVLIALGGGRAHGPHGGHVRLHRRGRFDAGDGLGAAVRRDGSGDRPRRGWWRGGRASSGT